MAGQNDPGLRPPPDFPVPIIQLVSGELKPAPSLLAIASTIHKHLFANTRSIAIAEIANDRVFLS
jgi:hypothetical protein